MLPELVLLPWYIAILTALSYVTVLLPHVVHVIEDLPKDQQMMA